MKILITGADGFIGKNISLFLENEGYNDIVKYDINTPIEILEDATKNCDFVLHFAGVNRPKNDDEFMEGNFGFTTTLLDLLKKANNKCPILTTSSIQASKNNLYGESKKAMEDYLFEYEKTSGSNVLIYRLPNVFGKWCRPNYNSAIATFCNNIANNLPITVNDRNINMHVVYIDDIAQEILNALKGNPNKGDNVEISSKFCMIAKTYKTTLGEIVDLIYSFKESRKNFETVNVQIDSLSSKLYSTYLSYLPTNDFAYPLKMNIDQRGSFTEFLRTPERGQVSINVAKKDITKGNHWHHSKNEKFLVVSGKASIKFKNLNNDELIEYIVSSEKLEVVDIPVGYTHNITNIGDGDLVTVMWANEPFNPQKPDTYLKKVDE